MGAAQNVETVKALYDAFGRGDVESILAKLTDDVDWAADAADDTAPWHGERHGKDEVVGFFQGIADTGPITRFEPLAFTSNDDDEVMVLIAYAFTVSATGKDVASNLHHYWKFRDGKVCRYRGSEDSAQIAAAMTG